MKLLKRKADIYLEGWFQNEKRKPLIINGARQVGKTMSVRTFAKAHYESVVEINFVLEKKYQRIFDDGYDVDTVLRNITMLEPSWKLIPGKTLIFFDEINTINLLEMHRGYDIHYFVRIYNFFGEKAVL